MRTITKADLIDRINIAYHAKGDPKTNRYIRDNLKILLDSMNMMVLNGFHIRLKKLGWLGGKFKKGGRPVRNPKTGESSVMHDTYSIRLRPHLGREYQRLNASDIPGLVESAGVPEEFTKIAYQVLVDTIHYDVLGAGDRIELRNFGGFRKVIRAERMARNPRTGEPVSKAERAIVAFKPPKFMAEKMLKASQNVEV